MLTIQQGAKEIFSNPQSLYFFTGTEYGVKLEYIKKLCEYYDCTVESYPTISDVLSVFRTKAIIARPKKVYVVRYDKSFLAELKTLKVTEASKFNISGTLIGIYQDDEDEKKLDKYFPNNVLRLNPMSEAALKSHLESNFPSLSELHIKEAMRLSSDYYQASTICNMMVLLGNENLNDLSSIEIEYLFGYSSQTSSEKFKQAVLSRNFASLMKEVEADSFDASLAFYDILAACLDMVKVLNAKYIDSYASKYSKKWSLEEICSFYELTYQQLLKLRSNSKYDPKLSIMYLCCLLQYRLS